MAITLVATPGAPNANTYATRAEADAYFTTRLHADRWLDADGATEKDVALVWATRLLDAQIEWTSWPTLTTQALAWPRVGMENRNGNDYVLDGVIPQDLKNATAELALHLIIVDRTLEDENVVKGITSLRAGPVSLSFSGSASVSRPIPQSVFDLLPAHWMANTGRGSMNRDIARA